MNKLPEGWAVVSLGEICGQGVQRVPCADEDFTYIDIGSIDRQRKVISNAQKIPGAEAPSRARKLVEKGDIIVSMTRPNLNAVALIDNKYNECIVSTGFDVLKPIGAEPLWVFAVVRSAAFVDSLCEKVQGALYPAVKPADIREYKLPLPPLAEQTRIAAKLDELLAHVDALKARIDGIPELLKRFRQSVLAAAVSGRLTQEWRAASGPTDSTEYQSIAISEPWSHTIDAPDSWRKTIFEDVIKLIGGSQPPKSEFTYEQAPGLIRLIQIRDYKSDSHKVFIKQSSTKKRCNKDDIMIGRYGPPIFQILRGLEGAYNVALMKAVPLEGLDNNYMYWYLQNYKLLNFVEAGSDRTAGQSGVNKSFLEKYPLFLPPIEEQIEIVHCVEQLFSFSDQVEARVKAAQARIDYLTQSILTKAFSGELVPQDPNDEPASVLLERIKTQHAVAPKAKRGRRAATLG